MDDDDREEIERDYRERLEPAFRTNPQKGDEDEDEPDESES